MGKPRPPEPPDIREMERHQTTHSISDTIHRLSAERPPAAQCDGCGAVTQHMECEYCGRPRGTEVGSGYQSDGKRTIRTIGGDW